MSQESHPGPDRGRAVPSGLLGMLVLMGAIELYFARHNLELSNVVISSWKQSGREATRSAVKSDVLLFGDSLVKFGVFPRVIEAKTGLKAYNLAGFAAKAPTDYVLLKRALDAGAKPKAIVLEAEQHFLSVPPRDEYPRHWQDLLSPRECLDLAWTSRDGDFFARTMSGILLQSVRSRVEIRLGTMAALKGETPASRDEVLIARKNWSRNRGAQVMPLGHFQPEAMDRLCKEFFPDTWAPDPVNTRYLRRFLALARDHKIPVFWLVPPLSPPNQERREKSGLDRAYVAYIQAVAKLYPNVTVVDGRHSGYDSDCFFDPFHLNGHPGSILSADLGTTIAALLQAPGDRGNWVVLPAYQERSVAGESEDLNQTRTAFQLEKTRIR